MAQFKYKPDKIKYRDNITTLDETHRKIISDFERNRKSLDDKKKKLRNLQETLNTMNQPGKVTTGEAVRKKALLKEEISRLTDDIKDTEFNTSEIDYYSRIDDVLVQYYDIVGKTEHQCESKDLPLNISEKEDSTLDTLNKLNKKPRKIRKPSRKRVRARSGNVIETKSILCFFGEGASKEAISKGNDASNTDKKSVVIEKSTKNRASLFEEYVRLVNNNHVGQRAVKKKGIKICQTCQCEKTLIHSEGMYVCQSCGMAEYVVVDSDIPNFKDSTTEKPTYPYKRLNHLVEFSRRSVIFSY